MPQSTQLILSTVMQADEELELVLVSVKVNQLILTQYAYIIFVLI